MGVCRPFSGGAARAWYPSGPRLDGKRSSDSYSPEPEKKPRKKKESEKIPGNPDPFNYKIVSAEEVGRFLILKINYPDCVNYEGNKILVFRDLTLIDLVNQKLIDPHFFNDEKFKSPVARFVPTDEGWDMAVNLAKMLTKEN